MSGYIGDIATTISASNATAAVVFQVAAHGVSGGGISYAQGGSFGSGFTAGALSSVVGSGAGRIARNLNKTWTGVVQIGAGSLSGGAGSVLAGGNFWDGLKQGAITAALNHFAHEIRSNKAPIIFIDDNGNINDLEAYITMLRDQLIDNGFSENLRIVKSTSWSKFKAYLNGNPTANVSIRDRISRGDLYESGVLGFARLGSNNAVVYSKGTYFGRYYNPSLIDLENVTVHELGHAIFSFKHTDIGIMTHKYNRGSPLISFSNEQINTIRNSIWGQRLGK